MITPFDVYWIFKLDALRAFFIVLSGICGVAFFVSIFVYTATMDSIKWAEPTPSNEERHRRIAEAWTLCTRRLAKAFFIALASFAIYLAIPSTPLAAGMILLPKLASEEVVATVKGEARELYDLAKELLRSSLANGPKSPK